MILGVRIRNFKCFEDQRIAFGRLTLLSGMNSSGKSTVLQSLLLLRQSYLDRLLPAVGLSLNGTLVRLGSAQDILFENANDETITFGLETADQGTSEFRFQYDKDADVLKLQSANLSEQVFLSNLFTDEFQYLQAERLGPRNAFEMSDFSVRRHRDLGTSGEYTAHFLSCFGSEAVGHSEAAHPKAQSATLIDQTEAWMSEISPGLRLHHTAHPAMDLVNLRVSYTGFGRVGTSEYRPTNVGFGITYALPVVVALLSRKASGFVVVENPEAHLHPRAQVIVGELMARVAAAGVQVLVETHSDHVLNGIRLAVKNGVLESKYAQIHFFRNTDPADSSDARVVSPNVDSDGRIDKWPEGFFDEIERSLEQLL